MIGQFAFFPAYPLWSVIVIGIYGEPNVAVWGGLMTAGAVANRHVAELTDITLREKVIFAVLALAVLGMVGAVVAGFFHYMKVGPIEEKQSEKENA